MAHKPETTPSQYKQYIRKGESLDTHERIGEWQHRKRHLRGK